LTEEVKAENPSTSLTLALGLTKSYYKTAVYSFIRDEWPNIHLITSDHERLLPPDEMLEFSGLRD
jgi:hypothetical protein